MRDSVNDHVRKSLPILPRFARGSEVWSVPCLVFLSESGSGYLFIYLLTCSGHWSMSTLLAGLRACVECISLATLDKPPSAFSGHKFRFDDTLLAVSGL